MTTDEIGAQILSEHNDLRAVLQALEEHLRQPADSGGWLSSLQDELSGLLNLCSAHFRVEEEGGLHIQLRDQAPRLASRLEKLVSDHSRILESLQVLLTELQAETFRPNEPDPPCKKQVLRVLESLREHERAENEVMMDTYWNDLGGESG